MPPLEATQSLETALSTAWPTANWRDVTSLVGVSGGPDSVALLRAIARLRPVDSAGQIVVAHYNHGWRGAASDADEAFVASLAAELKLPFYRGQSDPSCGRSPDRTTPTTAGLPALPKISEESARDERYAFLLATGHQFGARYIAVGHTADDQAETILFRLLRGTGLTGLKGMPAHRKLSEAATLVRPLLGIRRAMVIDYLQALDQAYRIDASNTDTRFARNRLRQEVLPALQAIAPGDVVDNLLLLGRQAAELMEPVWREAAALLDSISAVVDDAMLLHLNRLTHSPTRPVVREMFVELWRRQGWPRGEMTFERWDELAEIFLTRSEPTRMFPHGIRLELRSDTLRITAGGGN